MSSFTLEIRDKEVIQALDDLSKRVKDMSPVMKALGLKLVEQTQRRIDSGTDPDGHPFKANSPVTLKLFAAQTSEKSSYRRKNGELNKAGRAVLANKSPLINTRDLFNSIFMSYGPTETLVSSRMPYSAIQHFGGKTGAGSWIPGATIPARPFMSIRADGTLYESDKAVIFQAINDYISEGLLTR